MGKIIIGVTAACGNLGTAIIQRIIGGETDNDFSPIVKSNRQTEEDVKNSGLQWAIGRNGLYIEPDLDYLDNYVKEGAIINCAGDGKCGYTSRTELAFAYWKMLVEEKHNRHTCDLSGEAITQSQLAEYINQLYLTSLSYIAIPADEYKRARQEDLGEFPGRAISGIYDGISKDLFTIASDFELAAGRSHESALEMIRQYKTSQNDR